jgi:hypothetical protein
LLIEALISSLPLLGDIFIIILFYFVILSIAGVELWHGVLKGRCFDFNSGTATDNRNCGSHDCGDQYCVKYISNPNYGGTSYDDILMGLLTAFQCVTLENWSNVEQNVSDAFGPFATIYYTFHTLFGAFFLMNFNLAVIKSRVTKIYEEARENKGKIVQQVGTLSGSELQNQAERKVSMAQLLKAQKDQQKVTMLESKLGK